MKQDNLQIIISLFLILHTHLVTGQSLFEVKLTIDTNCLCQNSLITKQEGKFGIYAYTPVPKYSDNYSDTLISELEQKSEQSIFLEHGSYKLIYTPNDSTERKKQYYFALGPYETKIHLNCFFFGKTYASLIDQMGKKDTLIISSTYFGMTHEESIIPTHTLVLTRKRKKYYASYYNFEQRGIMGLDFSLISEKNGDYENRILLTEDQVLQFRDFEKKLLDLSINDNLSEQINSKNYIWINTTKIDFDSKGYVALTLWNELSEKH